MDPSAHTVHITIGPSSLTFKAGFVEGPVGTIAEAIVESTKNGPENVKSLEISVYSNSSTCIAVAHPTPPGIEC